MRRLNYVDVVEDITRNFYRRFLVGQVAASKALKSCSRPARPRRLIPPRPTKRSRILRLLSNALANLPKAPEALRKLAGLAQQQGEMQEAIGYYERVLAEYPASEHGDEAQFMIAFIYEEHIRDLAQGAAGLSARD